MARRKRSLNWCVTEVNRWVPRLGLGDWTIYVTIGVTPRKAAMFTTWPREGDRKATIVIAEDQLREPERVLTHLLIHELMHLVLARVDDTLYDYLGEGRVAERVGKDIEQVCDVLASSYLRAYKRRGMVVAYE